MTFLAPGFLIAAGIVAAGVGVLHLIITREPSVFRLPTARFAPEIETRERSRAIEPRHLLLMLLRMAVVLVIGAALARPVLAPARTSLIRIVLLDRSRAVADPREAADSARRQVRPGDVLIGFDSAAAELSEPADSLAAWARNPARGRLSTALIAGLRAASRHRARADSIELVLISAMAREQVDAATDSIRRLWPASITVVPVTARTDTASTSVTLRGGPDDPLRYALPPASAAPGAIPVVVVRGTPAALDSQVTVAGGVLVVWPEPPVVPEGWQIGRPDTVGAVAAGPAVVVAPFVRTATHPESDAAPVIARWVDGTPAATERPAGQGCSRAVTVPVPRIGDLVLEPRFRRLVAELTAPCGGRVDWTPIDTTRLARLADAARPARALAAGLAPVEQVPAPWSRWLLVLALLLLAGEWLGRRTVSP